MVPAWPRKEGVIASVLVSRGLGSRSSARSAAPPSASRTGRGWAGPSSFTWGWGTFRVGGLFSRLWSSTRRGICDPGKEGSLHSGPSIAVEVDGEGTCMWRLFTGQAALQALASPVLGVRPEVVFWRLPGPRCQPQCGAKQWASPRGWSVGVDSGWGKRVGSESVGSVANFLLQNAREESFLESVVNQRYEARLRRIL